jgi:hypothetical protein
MHRDNTKFLLHLHEPDLHEHLEDISELAVGADVVNVEFSLSDALTDVVVLDVDVLAPVVVNRIFA